MTDRPTVSCVGEQAASAAAALAADDRIEETTEDPSGAVAEADCVVVAGAGSGFAAVVEAVRERDGEVPVVLAEPTGSGSEPRPRATVAVGAGLDGTAGDGATDLAEAVVAATDAVRRRRGADRERQWLRELAANTDDVLWSFTSDWGEVLFVNEAYERLYGASVDRLRAHPESFLEAVNPEDREDVRAAMERLSAGDSVDVEYRVDETVDYGRWVWVRGEPVFEDSEVVRVVGFSRDVTDRREHEKELERQNERLEEFASVVSHDLRNPLNTVDASLQLAQETGDPEHFDRGRRAVERMERLIDDLLTLARQGETVAEPEAVSLDRAVQEAWTGVGPDRAGELVVDTDRRLLAEPVRLHQLLENLLRNAVEHGGEGVRVTVGDHDDGFYVADDGPGIPEEERERVFERGYSTGEGGTGFGLRIVEEVAEAHGWAVAVTDGESGGARVDVTGVEFAAEDADAGESWYRG